MPNNETAINGLKDLAIGLVRGLQPQLPKSTQGNVLLFALFVVAQCAREQGAQRGVIDEFLSAIASKLRQSNGKDPTAAMDSVFRTLSSRAMARDVDLKLTSVSQLDKANGVIGGLATDLLELANEPAASDARIGEMAQLLGTKIAEMRSPIRELLRKS